MHNINNGLCLMVKTKDERIFYTKQENYNDLLEFARLFEAELIIVKTQDVKILDLKELAAALCDNNYKIQQPKICEPLCVKQKRQRKTIIKSARKIRKYIEKTLLKEEAISIKELLVKFAKYDLSCWCYYNHMKQIKLKLKNKGYEIIKTGGKYRLKS